MRKFIAALLLLMMLTGVSATSIVSEELEIDLEEKRAEVDLIVEELTSSKFTYSTGMNVGNVVAASDGSEVSCEIQAETLGDEILCETEKSKNFSIQLTFNFEGLKEKEGKNRIFRYTHPFYRPTENFQLTVRLPRGTGILEKENGSPEIFPETGETGSDGRRIFVQWTDEPSLGTMNYRVRYETLSEQSSILPILGGGLIALILALLSFYGWRFINREKLDTVYDQISEDQRSVLEMVRENDGEMLQKDVVDRSDYSKAKISGIVSELVDEEILEKEKKGRSNLLKISRKFSY